MQSVLNLVVTMLSARYLGPSNYGLINYAMSIVAFMVPVMQLGFRSTLVQEFVESPEQEGKILGTAITLNILAAVACIVGISCFVPIVNASEPQTILVCVLYSISLLFQATEMIWYWFQAKLLSRYTSLVMLASYVVVSVYKIFLLATDKSVYWFAVAYSIDYSLISVALFIIYHKVGGLKLGFSRHLVGKLLHRSKYYIISGLMVTIFQQTDRIMLKLMIDSEATGFYSAAVSCAGITGFIYNAIIDSSRPVILESKLRSNAEFESRLIQLYSVVIWMSIALGVVMTFGSKLVVRIIYGAEYLPAAEILSLVVWFVTFAYLGTVRNIWILAEGKQQYLWIINLSGAIANVILNLFLIPVWGAKGAAFASVITQFFTNFVLSFFIKPIRYSSKLIFAGLNPRVLLDAVRHLRK